MGHGTVTAIKATQDDVDALCSWVADIGNTTVWECQGFVVTFFDGWAYIVQAATQI